MKALVYLLIFVNVVVFLWETGFRNRSDGFQELAIPSHLERILLVEEAADAVAMEPDTSEAEAPEAPDEEPAPVVKPAPKVSDCFLIGPAQTQAQANELLDLLKSQVGAASIETKSGEIPSGWWVLFPKAPSLDAARENRRMLLDKGVVDMWVFEKGSLQGAISLGLYSTREQAEAGQKQLTDKNIVTELAPRLVQGKVFWLRIPWTRPPLELEEIIQLLNTQDPDSKIPAPVPCE